MASAIPFIDVPVIPVRQRIGTFYLASIKVEKLLAVCFSARLHATRDEEGYKLEGTQRELLGARLKEIAAFIDTPEYAFPNSIILSANSPERINGDSADDFDSIGEDRWHIDETDRGLRLIVPTEKRLAAVIDGQHRLFAYLSSSIRERQQDELVCSIFLDLPKPVQAYLFATINSKQKPVDKSQTYELFGYNLDDEPNSRWDPDKLAVFLARRLNTDSHSPLRGHVAIAASNDIVESRSEAKESGRWMVSMATVVEGISRLISANSTADALWLQSNPKKERHDLPLGRAPIPVFRDYYLAARDDVIYKILLNYLGAVQDVLWSRVDPKASSRIVRNVGLQALFDVFRELASIGRKDKDLSQKFFQEILEPAAAINFSDSFFAASGQGRGRIKNIILIATGLTPIDKFRDKPDGADYERLLSASGEEV